MVSAVTSQREEKDILDLGPFDSSPIKVVCVGFSLRTAQGSDFLIEIRETVGLQAKLGHPNK